MTFVSSISEETLKQIADLIVDGYGNKYIFEQFNFAFSHKVIYRAAKKFGVYERLKENNKKTKSFAIKDRVKNSAYERYVEFDAKYGEDVKRMINDGFHMSKILVELDLWQSFFTKYLKWKDADGGLKNQLSINSERVIRENGLRNIQWIKENVVPWNKKTITNDIALYYKELVENGLYRAQITRSMKKIYDIGPKKVAEIIKTYGKPNVKCDGKGKNNPAYGKTYIKGGRGIVGFILASGKKIYFRSSLEMKIYFYLLENDVAFSLSKHSIEYEFDGAKRTYNPDIVISDVIYEIKPRKLVSLRINVEKFNALKKYCEKFSLKCDHIFEDTFNCSFIDLDYVEQKIKDGILLLDQKQEERLKRIMKYESKNIKN